MSSEAPPSPSAASVDAYGMIDKRDLTSTHERFKRMFRFDAAAGTDPATPKPEGHARVVCISGV